MKEHYHTESESETMKLASGFAETLKPGDVVALSGELGTGKTVFARGIALFFKVTENITSPTFTIIHEYKGDVPLYHMDLYRMNTVREMCDIGVEDYFYSDGVTLVEWAEKLDYIYPAGAIRVTINHGGKTHRDITIERPDQQ